MSKICIRPAEVADIEKITAIYAHAVTNGTASYELDPPDLAEMSQRFTKHQVLQLPWIIAEDGDQLLGYAYAAPFRERRAYRFIVEDSIYIHPASQGRGVGTLLLEHLIKQVTNMGYRQMLAVIGDGSRHVASVKLHEKAGFVHAGKIAGSGYKHDRWLDTVFMQRSLNQGDQTPPDPESFPERKFREERE